MEERNLKSWEEFKKALDDLPLECESSSVARTSSPLLFRGQENSCWSLSTTLDRHRERMLVRDYYRLISKIKPQVESLTEKEWELPQYPVLEKMLETYNFDLEVWGGRLPGYPYMAYLRHHGFPSPLLDWTRSPFVAAYFAFSNASE